jgi:hypothetical protein
VLSVTEAGVVVRLSPQFTGFVPRLFLSDVRLRNPAKRFKEGDTLAAMVRPPILAPSCAVAEGLGARVLLSSRSHACACTAAYVLCAHPPLICAQLTWPCPVRPQVLTVDRENRRVQLTAKKSLLQSKLPLLTAFGTASPRPYNTHTHTHTHTQTKSDALVAWLWIHVSPATTFCMHAIASAC